MVVVVDVVMLAMVIALNCVKTNKQTNKQTKAM